MFDYKEFFNRYRKEHNFDLLLSFNMPSGYETAYGTFDAAAKTVFINTAYLEDAPDYEKAFYLFHELRHAEQYLHPALFSRTVNRSKDYVIMYNGVCFKDIGGKYLECKLEGYETDLTDIYLGQPYEIDANTYALEQVKKLYGDSEGLRELQAFFTPKNPVAEEVYDTIYAFIDEKTKENT